MGLDTITCQIAEALCQRVHSPGRPGSAAAGWHATSVEEADDIRAASDFQATGVCVAPNGVAFAGFRARLMAARAVWGERFARS